MIDRKIMKNKQYFFGAFISYFAIFFNIVAGLVYIPWMVGKIGQSNYALYTLANSFISLFLVDFGLSSAVSRFVAKYRAEGREEKASDLLGIVTKLYICIDAIIFSILLIVYFFISQIYKGLTVEEIELYKKLYIIVATYSVISFPFMPLPGIINAYEKFVPLKLCDMGQKILTIILVVIALLNNMNVIAVVSANAISGLIFIIIKLIIIRKTTPVKYKFTAKNKRLMKDVFSFSIWMTVISLAQRCIFNLAPTILGVVSTSKEIALFAPATSLEGYFYTIAAAVNGMFLAKISRYIAEDREEKILDLMIKIGNYQFVLLGLILIGFISLGQDFMTLWMGKEYLGSWSCTILLFIPDILLFSQQIANTTAIAKNKVKEISFGYIGMAVVSVTVSFVLCKKLGALGSAIAIALAYSFLFVFLNYVYYKQLNLNVFVFFKKCYLKFLLPLILSGALGYFVSNKLINISGWTGLIVKGAIVCVIYFICVLFMGFDKNSRKRMILLVKNKLHKTSFKS